MRLLFVVLLTYCLSLSAFAATVPDVQQIRQAIEQAKTAKSTPTQTELIQTLELALTMLNERDASMESIRQYQNIIDNFPQFIQQIRQQTAALVKEKKPLRNDMPRTELEQEILQVNSALSEEVRLARQEQEVVQEISDSLLQLPQQQTDIRRAMSDSERRLQLPVLAFITPLQQAQIYSRQLELAAQKAKLDELEMAQLSANNRQELARMRAQLHQQKSTQLDNYLQKLRNQLNQLRQQEAEQALASTEQLAENNNDLPAMINGLFNMNRDLSAALNQQAQRLEQMASQQHQATEQIIQVRQVLNTIREQAQWSGASGLLGETLRAQIFRLPEKPKLQQLDSDLGQLRVQRLYYEDLFKLPLQVTTENGQLLTREQQRIFDAQLTTRRELLTSLISGCDTLILEVTRLQVANSQLTDILYEIKEATHRYLFWTADIRPVTLRYPLEVTQSLKQLLSMDTLGQLGGAFASMFTRWVTVLPIIGALLLVMISISSRRHFSAFLARASQRVGKVTQDHFTLTVRTVFWSILVALPLPVLWAALGFGLQHAWSYPIAVAIGDSVTAVLPLLWVFMICATFARPDGLFMVHFRWPPQRVTRAMRYYSLTIGFIVPLLMLLIAFDNLEDRLFVATLGRLCFILICGALSLVTVSLKRAGIPLYLDKAGNGDNIINRVLWNLMICTPLVAILASCIGYLTTSQALLARLETSVAIWFLLLVLYHVIRRWMLIQRRRIAFDRARQRRAEILAQRARHGEEHNAESNDVDEPVIDLDTISAQSLRLVRSILTLIALVSVIVLWSEIHSAFSFLSNINLWDVSTTVRGVESLQPITLGSLLIAILVLIITAQLVRNLPALLELALLQHLNLTPGTGYAITTLTKYILILVGGLIAFSMIGIEWAKLQWLVAALGVGLGFGLQEIFANFISGLIILFEKPIRIGDTVTIRDLTGSITRINTRATTITDWDRKEIIVPNKAFITEQFINWSLSDSVTRVVLTIPAPANIDSKVVTQLLLAAAERCSYVLETPPPEAYLVDLQQGIQLFELRIHAAEMDHRMPLRNELHQLILYGFREQGIEMPFPPFQVRVETLANTPAFSNKGAPAARVYRSGGV